jgi:hypothetical protein
LELKVTEKGEGNEVLDVADIGSEPTDRGGESARGLDPSEDEIQAGVGLSFGVQVPSTDRTQLGGQNCDWGDMEFPPAAGIGDGNLILTYLFHLNTR